MKYTREQIQTTVEGKGYKYFHDNSNKNYDVIISVPKTEWKGGLENAMEYYIKTEEYEECSKIKKLIERL